MRKYIITIIAMLASSLLASAQLIENIKYGQRFTVAKTGSKTAANNGFCQKGDIDYEAIVRTFGKPDRFPTVEESRGMDISEGRVANALFTKNGKKDIIQFHNNRICTILLKTNRFAAFKDMVPGGVRVGDQITVITSRYKNVNQVDGTENTFAYEQRFREAGQEDNEEANFIVYHTKTDYPYYFMVENGIITYIYYNDFEFGEE